MNGHATATKAPGTNGAAHKPTKKPMYSIPVKQRPPYGSWWTAIMFPLVWNLGMLGINSAQFLFVPLLLIPGIGRALFHRAIDWTKDGFGRLLIAITVLFAPTSLVITTDGNPVFDTLVERDAAGNVTRINLPDRLVLMSNHQAYLDWMYLWMLACYAGHAEGLTILLKASLQHIPILGWGMRFFRFIFMHRSWAADKDNLQRSLERLAKQSTGVTRAPLWLLIFPEGTITSDDERAKSVRYAEKQGVRDFEGVLHPRSTGLLFCLRTLVHRLPDLQLLDITIGYPGVPFGAYPQEWYGLTSVFWKGVPPPVVRVHLKMYSNLASPSSEVPSLLAEDGSGTSAALASPEQARAFELWLRGVWGQKEKEVQRFAELSTQAIESGTPEIEVNDGPVEVVPIVQHTIGDWIAAFGGGGMGLAALLVSLVQNRGSSSVSA